MQSQVTLLSLCSAASILLFAWQPFPGEYRVGILALIILGSYRLLIKPSSLTTPSAIRLLQLLACTAIPAIASLGWSINKGSTLEGIGTVLMSAVVGLSMITGLEDTKIRLIQQRGITIVVSAWILIACIHSIVSIILHGSIETLTPSLAFFTSSRFGRLLTTLMPLALWRPIQERRFCGFGLLIGAGIAIIATGQRNNILSYLIGLYLLLSKLPKKTAIWIFATAAAIILCLYPFSPELKTRTQQVVSSIHLGTPVAQQKTNQTASIDTSFFDRFNIFSNDRGFIYDAAINMARSNPITGVGAFAFKDAYPHFADKRDAARFPSPPGPHSVYLGILAQTGIIGMAGLTITMILLVRWHFACHDSTFNREQSDPYFASLIVMLFPLITQNDFYSSFFSTAFLYMSCGLLTASILPDQKLDLQGKVE